MREPSTHDALDYDTKRQDNLIDLEPVLCSVIATLPLREIEVLILRYYDELTQAAISKMGLECKQIPTHGSKLDKKTGRYYVCKGQISNIEKKALKHLRTPERSRRLLDYLPHNRNIGLTIEE